VKSQKLYYVDGKTLYKINRIRILRIAFDGDEVIAKSSLIGDVLSKRDAIKMALKKSKNCWN